jgi:uncharacterized protein
MWSSSFSKPALEVEKSMAEVINNSEHRLNTLRTIIEQLHQGAKPEAVKHQLSAIVKQATAGEIAAMEQELIARGMKVEEIMSMCDLHHEVVLDLLAQGDHPLPSGHPAETLRRENAALTMTIRHVREAMDQANSPSLLQEKTLLTLRQGINELQDIEKHYQRKENLFFSRLEQHAITGPSKVMWGKDDEVRSKLKAFAKAVADAGSNIAQLRNAISQFGQQALSAIEDMISKENNILIPMCLETFIEDDWAAIWQDSPRYGWCLVEPGKEYRPSPSEAAPPAVTLEPTQGIDLGSGVLKLDQLRALFTGLPVDLTFVDAEDTVRFFSEGPDRIFPRSKAIIGRKVQHCHPPKSVDVVERILSDLRFGRQNKAEFWINFHGRFVHIRYFALHDEQRNYLGCLEVTQDLTGLRALQGERRLLEYDTP